MEWAEPRLESAEDECSTISEGEGPESTVEASDTEDCVAPNMVRLNVYDLHRSLSTLNDFLQEVWEGGLYHVGVEVFGLEYMYSAGESQVGRRIPANRGFAAKQEQTTGILWHKPRRHGFHSYKKSIDMGLTRIPFREVVQLIAIMSDQWRPMDYNIMNKNCVHFADAFTRALGVGAVPTMFLGFKVAPALAPPDNSLTSALGSAWGAVRNAMGFNFWLSSAPPDTYEEDQHARGSVPYLCHGSHAEVESSEEVAAYEFVEEEGQSYTSPSEEKVDGPLQPQSARIESPGRDGM